MDKLRTKMIAKTMQKHKISTPPNQNFTCPQVNFQGLLEEKFENENS